MAFKINTLQKCDTTYTADCVDFCPIDNYYNYLLVGTYQLTQQNSEDIENQQQERIGKLYLFTIEEKSFLKLKQELKMAGILDAKWCHYRISDNSIIYVAIVNAEGKLLIYEFDETEENLKLRREINVANTSLALHVDWCRTLACIDNACLTITDAVGNIHIYCFINNEFEFKQIIKAHNYEAWIAVFNFSNSSIVYSGGDDSKFCGFDLRKSSQNCNIFINKEHNAGVTSIEPCFKDENYLYTGSYDEILRLWDTRNMKNSVTDTKIGGGLWRLRSHYNKGNPLLLASCMHEGFKIVNGDPTKPTKILATYDEHQSLAYGADWIKEPDVKGFHTIASVSFYDHLLCLWTFNNENA